MPVTTHDVVKPQAIADAAVTAIGDQLVVANTFTTFAVEEFLGRAGDKITKRVPGSLPFRRWGFRNDRREALRVDRYNETTVDMTVDAEWLYSALEMTPEQKTFDFGGAWGQLFNLQTQAIAQGFEFDAFQQLKAAPYERVKVIDNSRAAQIAAREIGQDALFNSFVDLQADLRNMRVPDQRFICIAGSEVVSELIKSNKLVRSGGQGESAFASATLGTYAGITFVQGPYTLEPNEAYMYAPSGFLLWNAAPPIPDGPGKYANASQGGVSLQWIKDFDPSFQTERSIYLTWKASNYTKDFISLETGTGRTITSPEDYFLRGVKIILNGDPLLEREPGDGSTDTPGGNPESFLALAYTNQLAQYTEVDGPFIPFELREGTVTENVADTTGTTTP